MIFKNGQLSNKNHKPIYYRNWKIYSLTFQKVFRSFISRDSSLHIPEFLSSDSVVKIHQLRKKLLLYKLVRFNDQYYSTPTIPAFPSSAYDNMVSKGGLNFLSAGTKAKRQVDSVFLAITNKCNLKCAYCYERQNINNPKNIPIQKWQDVIRSLQKVGVNVFILTGGEPLLEFDKLIAILKSANQDESDFHLHTSGYSVTEEKVRALKEAGLKAVAVGLDDFDEFRYDKIRGKGSFYDAVKALQLFNQVGIMTYVNFCVRKEMLIDDRLFQYYDFVKKLNVSMIQLLEPRPCGGYLNNGFHAWLDDNDREKLTKFTYNGNRKKSFKNHPLVYYVAHIEGKNQLGCHMGGLSHFYIDSLGNVCPCVFFPVKYGNLLEENIIDIYRRMRTNIPAPFHVDCPSLMLTKNIKEIYLTKRELPIPYSLIQKDINSLYNNSPVFVSSNNDSEFNFELKGHNNEKADIH